MVAKKTTEKKVEKAVEQQSDKTTFELEQTIAELNKTITDIIKENETLENNGVDLLNENDKLKSQLIEGASTKQQLLMALAPQVDITHPQSSAQKVLAAVDVIMNVWGME